jgi:SAM-dependent methyltransferase
MSLSVQTSSYVYSAPEVASHYATLDYLTPCEQFLFATYLKSGAAILDLGVGGGRTTPYLSRLATRYVGVDYSAQMLKICRKKFPYLEFVQANAADMPMFSEESFDTIIFSFNGLDTLAPYEEIEKCLRECRRLLRPGGIFIFSSHNPRAVIVWSSWNSKRLRLFARKLVGEASLLFKPTLILATWSRGVLAFGSAWFASCARLFRRMFQPAFWRGKGYLYDSAHGGLLIHCGVPERVIAEVQRFDFQHLKTLGDDYPRTSREYVTEWYYYVFEKAQRSVMGEPCV